MAKIKSKQYIGIREISKIEVKSDSTNLTNSYVSVDGVVHHNCNGPHVPLVVIDEIDTVSGEGVKAFKEISGMLDSKGDKIALRVGISTRKSRYGLMNRQIENAHNEARIVRRWTAFEFSQRCTDERSGTTKISLYINQDKMETLTEEEFLRKEKSKQKDYVQHDAFDKCAKCPIFPICLTDAKKQASKSPMLKPLDELIKKALSEGADWALAQLMNLKPSVEGIVFREFDEKIHVKNWNEMWFTLMQKEYPGECTHDIFVKQCHYLKLPCYAGVDWGWSNPNTVTYFFVDKKENIYIVKTDGMTYMSQPAWSNYLKTKYHNKYRCQLYAPDPADQGAIKEMQLAGLPVANENKGAINTGVQIIKKYLKVPGGSESKIFVAKETCSHIINEFNLYHYKTDLAGEVTDDFDSEHDHWIDGFRYMMVILFGGNALTIGNDERLNYTEEGIIDHHGSYMKAPSISEFAQVNNININQNEQDISKLGRIGTSSQLESDEDEIDGSGGFLWSLK